MKKKKYLDQKNTASKKILITFVILVFILFFLYIILIIAKKNNQPVVEFDRLKTVKDVLKYYDCLYISEEKSIEKGYAVDINLKFKYNLYNEDDTSNEIFFNNIINDLARVLYFNNYRLIDKKNDIEIKVICKNKNVNKIIINGREDYFIYMDSQISLKKYVEIKPIEFSIESSIIKSLIESDWNKIDFGTRECIFNSYNIFFDEGINVRYINNKVYNIIFTTNYKQNVINDIYPGMDLKAIQAKLGKPTFKDEKLDVIGYKGNNIYIFFTEDEISVYRVSEEMVDEFFLLTYRFINEELDLLEYMNELTYMWPDYSEYNYTSSEVFLSYPLKGIDIKINYEDTTGIILYNNLNMDINQIKNYLENTEFIARLKLDNVYEAEKRRYKTESNLLPKCEETWNNKDDEEKQKIGQSNLFGVYEELDNSEIIMGIKFISKDRKYPNREIIDYVSSYLWLNDEIFIYSKDGKGIYFYNTITGEIGNVILGNEKFDLKEYKDGILKYDNSQIVIEY